ncbi:MAG: hypothetical protein V4690_00605 [Patescibacteria group bacterium]
MMNRNSLWMAISGVTGFLFFLVANLSELFVGLNLLAGSLQLCLNIFVFTVWLKAFRELKGLKKFVAFWGVCVPVVMASYTLYKVFLPTLQQYMRS